jgi:hypothetical protein
MTEPTLTINLNLCEYDFDSDNMSDGGILVCYVCLKPINPSSTSIDLDSDDVAHKKCQKVINKLKKLKRQIDECEHELFCLKLRNS